MRTVRNSNRLSRGRGSASVHAAIPTPQEQAHPPGTPPGTRHTPPGPGTPPDQAPPWDQAPPQDQTPWDQAPPRSRPPWDQAPPGSRPPQDQAPAPQTRHPPGSRPPCGQTRACENITFATSLRTVINSWKGAHDKVNETAITHWEKYVKVIQLNRIDSLGEMMLSNTSEKLQSLHCTVSEAKRLIVPWRSHKYCRLKWPTSAETRNRKHAAVADPGFPRRGGRHSREGYFAAFCQKLHGNERIWTGR